MFSLEKKHFINIAFYIFVILLIGIIFIYLDRNYSNSKINKDSKIYDLGNGRKILGQEMRMQTEEEPRMLKSIGSKLLCDSITEITNQKVLIDHKIPGTRSPISGVQLGSDCFLENLNVAFDYNPKEIFEYEKPDAITKNIYEFYYRLAIKESKKDQFNNKDIKFIEVPYYVDMCVKNGKDYNCDDKTDISTRKHRIKTYLRENIDKILV